MIAEDYVSLETAKLLKKNGFDERLMSYYTESGLEGYMFALKATKNTELNSGFISRPTLQMAMKWLREVHYYNIEIDTLGMMELNTLSWRSAVYYLVNENECYCEDGFDSYEEACEAAIKYCLEKLI